MMYVKPLGTELDWPITWELAEGETIETASQGVYPEEAGGISVKSESSKIEGATTSCLFVGGVLGHLYEATTTIVTNQGRTNSQTITLIMGISLAAGTQIPIEAQDHIITEAGDHIVTQASDILGSEE